MTYTVDFTSNSERDLLNIMDYISMSLNSISAAQNFYDAMMEKLNYLKDNPFMYEEVNDPKLKQRGYRKVVVENYVMLYLVEDNLVSIVRIFYERQNYLEHV